MSQSTARSSASQCDPQAPLADRLRAGVLAVTDPIPTILLKKYIAYARYVRDVCVSERCLYMNLNEMVLVVLMWRYGRILSDASRRNVFPRLLPEAAAVLKDFYISLRREHGDDEAAPITTRQLESLIRLSQARAKMELREVRCCCGRLWWHSQRLHHSALVMLCSGAHTRVHGLTPDKQPLFFSTSPKAMLRMWSPS